MPCLVAEMGVGGYAIHFHVHLLEHGIDVCEIFQFRGAHEGEIRGIEEKYGPFALGVLVGHGQELALLVSLGGEGLDLFVQNGHGYFLCHGWEKFVCSALYGVRR